MGTLTLSFMFGVLTALEFGSARKFCGNTCYDRSCDYWSISRTNPFDCATLEAEYHCDCSECTCPYDIATTVPRMIGKSCDVPHVPGECQDYFSHRMSQMQGVMSDCKAIGSGRKPCTRECYKHLSDGYLKSAWKTCKQTVSPLLALGGVTATQIDTILGSCKAHIATPACVGEKTAPGRTEKPSLPCDLPRASKDCSKYFWSKASFLKSVVSHCSAKCESWCQIHLSDGHLGYAWKTCSKKVRSMLQLISISARQLGAILESCKAPVANSDCSISPKSPETTPAPVTSAPIRVSAFSIATVAAAREVTKPKMKSKTKLVTTQATMSSLDSANKSTRNFLPYIISTVIGVLVVAAAIIGVVWWRQRRHDPSETPNDTAQPIYSESEMHRDLGQISNGHMLDQHGGENLQNLDEQEENYTSL